MLSQTELPGELSGTFSVDSARPLLPHSRVFFDLPGFCSSTKDGLRLLSMASLWCKVRIVLIEQKHVEGSGISQGLQYQICTTYSLCLEQGLLGINVS